MRLNIFFILFVSIIINGCKKDKNSNTGCFSNTATVRQITDMQATVKSAGAQFYLLEQGTIDTKLNPCNLTQEFQIDNLQVTISGDVKSTIQVSSMPCCTENFVITKIVR